MKYFLWCRGNTEALWWREFTGKLHGNNVECVLTALPVALREFSLQEVSHLFVFLLLPADAELEVC